MYDIYVKYLQTGETEFIGVERTWLEAQMALAELEEEDEFAITSGWCTYWAEERV